MSTSKKGKVRIFYGAYICRYVLVKMCHVKNTYKIWDQSTVSESSCISFGKINTIRLEISLGNGGQEIVIAAIEQRIAEYVQCWCKWCTANQRNEKMEHRKDN
jgi:hypothetical protein